MKRLLILVVALFWTLPARAEIAIQEVTSPGGITAWLVEEHALPFMALEIRFRGGASLDAPGKRGATVLMSGLIEEGAGDMDARGFAEAREALAASFRFDAHDDAFTISAQFLTENRDAAVALLRTALTQPRFDTDAIERVRGQVLSHLTSRETDPMAMVSDRFSRLAFGEHPYGSYSSGTPDSVSALTRNDIVAAFNGAIARDRIYVGAVGDISAEALGTLLDDLFGDLPETGAAIPDRVEFSLGDGVTVVDFDTPQSVARFGHVGITRDDPDFFAAYVVNEILGGSGFNSRLMDEVREKRGLTYGIGTYLIPMDLSEYMIGQVSSQNDTMAEVVEVVRAEWARMAQTGVSAEELASAQTYLTGAYPLRFDGNGPIANIMVGMQMQGLPLDYIATRNDQIMAVTLDEANRVAARIYDPEALHFVIVGRPEGVSSTE
ncbi:pitrilysin family protein [Aliiroseovarius subalbicans]|uniref:M16 family metallopeptidase n=1 Tax=Aliiroseovarius subalbicans TaxID=2925840 RepID=UPI001F590D06|nr:pitrilysin family protein [Aliiroseovarius subalbicans]MCI2399837.1 insulinase family protein [Aliiroseovarius subalbicans]